MKVCISAIPLRIAKPYIKGWDKNRYADIFKKYTHKPSAYRIYLPLGIEGDTKSISIPGSVESLVTSKGYKVEDYLAGIAVKVDEPKRKIRIGKLLDKDTKKIFDNDPQRQATKSVKQWVVISRHPYDILGMSFDRGWTSCMNLVEGCNKHYLKEDIKHGTIVAYLIKDLDKNINNPTARVLIKPFVHEFDGSIYLSPESSYAVYGSAPPSFYKTVLKWCKEIIPTAQKEGKYSLHKELYADKNVLDLYHLNPITFKSFLDEGTSVLSNLGIKVKSNNIDTLIGILSSANSDKDFFDLTVKSTCWNNSKIQEVVYKHTKNPDILKLALDPNTSDKAFETAYQNDNAPEEVVLEGLNRLTLNSISLLRLVVRKNVSSKVLDKVLTLALDINAVSPIAAISQHPNASKETLLRIAEKGDNSAKINLAKNTTNKEVLSFLLDSKESSESVVCGALMNPLVEVKYLDKYSTNKSIDVREAVVLNKITPISILYKVFRIPNYRTFLAISHHPLATPELLSELFTYLSTEGNNFDEVLLTSMVNNPNTDVSLLEKIFDLVVKADLDEEILQGIVTNPNVSEELLIKAVRSEYIDVSTEAINSFKATPRVLIEAIKVGRKRAIRVSIRSNLPLEVQTYLVNLNNALILKNLVLSHTISEVTLKSIIDKLVSEKLRESHWESQVWEFLLNNPVMTEYLFDYAFDKGDAVVRHSIVMDNKCGYETKLKALADIDEVRVSVLNVNRKNKDFLLKALDSDYGDVRTKAAELLKKYHEYVGVSTSVDIKSWIKDRVKEQNSWAKKSSSYKTIIGKLLQIGGQFVFIDKKGDPIIDLLSSKGKKMRGTVKTLPVKSASRPKTLASNFCKTDPDRYLLCIGYGLTKSSEIIFWQKHYWVYDTKTSSILDHGISKVAYFGFRLTAQANARLKAK